MKHKEEKRIELRRNELHFYVQLMNKPSFYSKKYNRAKNKRLPVD